METFSSVFVLFQVMSWLFSIPLRTVNNTKTQGKVSVCTGPECSCIQNKDAMGLLLGLKIIHSLCFP